MHPTQHLKSHCHAQHSARASFSLSRTLQEHRGHCIPRAAARAALRHTDNHQQPIANNLQVAAPLCKSLAAQPQPEQRSAHSAKQWLEQRPKNRARSEPVNHHLTETLSVAVKKKSRSARGLPNLSNLVSVTATVRTSHHARSTTTSS